jgi:hypothetical protein
MSCESLPFSVTHSIIGSFGISITVTVPEIYNCTNIQLRLRSGSGIFVDWFDYAVLDELITTINYTFSPAICYIDVRLSQCCPIPPVVDPPPPEDDPPCSLISSSEDDCSPTSTVITNPYIKSEDSSITQSYNNIVIPKKLNLTINQNSCSDVSALLCTVRCVPPPPPPPPPPPEIEGECACNFVPSVDILSLSPLTIGRNPHGVPIDIDCLCTYEAGLRLRPHYGLPQYKRVEAYFVGGYGFSAVPFIDGVGYDTTTLNRQTWVKVVTVDNSEDLRSWLINHFRFFGISYSKTETAQVWPYTDLYWHPFDFCYQPNPKFTPESDVVYVKLIPC